MTSTRFWTCNLRQLLDEVGDSGDSNDNGESSDDEELWEGGKRDEENDEEIEQESKKWTGQEGRAAFSEMIALIAADNVQGTHSIATSWIAKAVNPSALVGVRAAEIDEIDDGIGDAFPSGKGGTAGKGDDQGIEGAMQQ
ncbi:hypothetical protein BT96DRAFT_945585 [Gymnopus androsaceus JB14]|uniref:Uncharacterized protein n=1 Tax=Gymnopus androsaceus JB14 TaxID=1447944 RepID=A0A6A4H0K7_9AGAR|nr:hypothetical protein BT96DRAFT_945585 [Gymnopus androsaceus JB14]